MAGLICSEILRNDPIKKIEDVYYMFSVDGMQEMRQNKNTVVFSVNRKITQNTIHINKGVKLCQTQQK